MSISLLTWQQDASAYAETYDESASLYRGLRSGVQIPITGEDVDLFVRPDVVRRQIDAETSPATGAYLRTLADHITLAGV